MMKYVIYLRISTKEQDLRTQEQKVLRVLREKEGKDVEYMIFTDSISTKKPLRKRRGLQEALNSLKRGDVLVGQKVDRIARNEEEAHTIKSFLEENKIGIYMIDQPGVSDPFIFSIYAAVAAQEVKLIRERIKDKLHAKQERGERTGAVRYGYRLDEDNPILINGKDKIKVLKPGMLLPRQDEQECLNLMCKLFDLGNSYRMVAHMINNLGYKNRKGNQWSHATVYRILIRTGRTRFRNQLQETEESAWTRRQKLLSQAVYDKV